MNQRIAFRRHGPNILSGLRIIGANSVVAKDIPPYTVAAGNPCRVVKKRFDDEFIAYLLDLKWWDWDIEKIEANFEALSSGDLSLIRKIKQYMPGYRYYTNPDILKECRGFASIGDSLTSVNLTEIDFFEIRKPLKIN